MTNLRPFSAGALGLRLGCVQKTRSLANSIRIWFLVIFRTPFGYFVINSPTRPQKFGRNFHARRQTGQKPTHGVNLRRCQNHPKLRNFLTDGSKSTPSASKSTNFHQLPWRKCLFYSPTPQKNCLRYRQNGRSKPWHNCSVSQFCNHFLGWSNIQKKKKWSKICSKKIN